ncbi:MAG: class I SAM-dependent methyltransferase [Deltaproteobacteria bacterium]|nr:class I SAM-dependent methyltransferase [Deltaproteobacteria bacterium]
MVQAGKDLKAAPNESAYAEKKPVPIRFNPLAYCGALLQEPKRLTDVVSWHEHIPFAFVLIEMLRPKVFVELGTHKGDSYLAFCQAVNTLGTDTGCFAVDTWKGEEHAGLYDDTVLEELRAHHDPLYGRFSTLIRSTFDEALAKFGDGTVDLLHIDGLHTYEAVKHDFETWLPKVSGRGVVLFHDITVRERDFGVWRFWDEVKGGYPHFDFRHGHGLGVLCVGKDSPAAMSELLNLSKSDEKKIQDFFFVFGHRMAPSAGIQARLQMTYERLLAERDAVIAEKNAQIQGKDEQIQGLRNSLSWKITAPLRKIFGLIK